MPQEVLSGIRDALDSGADVEGSAARRRLESYVTSFKTVSQ